LFKVAGWGGRTRVNVVFGHGLGGRAYDIKARRATLFRRFGSHGDIPREAARTLAYADQLKGKTKFPPAGGFAGTLLTNGEVDLAVQTTPELASVPGVEVVGPLPGDMSFTAAFAAGVDASAKQPDAAKAFLKFLTSPEALAVFKAKGFVT
jgi:ABC-type molybdate transport system substrate-binding protein